MVPSSDDVRRSAVGGNGPITWHDAVVPGEWRFDENPADHSLAVMYRKQFDAPAIEEHQRLFVRCNGIFNQADLWLDGAYLGDQDDYFVRRDHDITALARLEHHHELLIEVNGGRHAGIWQPVELKRTGPALIRSVRVLCRDANESRAHVLITAQIDTASSCTGTIRTFVNAREVSARTQSFSRGDNMVSWTIDIDSPKLWWPWSFGLQEFTDIEVAVDIDGRTSDLYQCRTGLREVSMTNWILTVNGERMYVKGAYMRQPDVDLGQIEPSTLAHDISLAKDAGLDLLRIRRHVAHPAVYQAADEHGLLLWQDMPERPSGKRGRRVAARWAQAMVNTLGHHPSVALWHHRALDQFTRRHFSRTDPTRPVVSHLSTLAAHKLHGPAVVSQVYDTLGAVGEEFESATAILPNLARFVTHEETNLFHSHHNMSNPKHLRSTIEHLRRTKYSPTGGFCFVGLIDSSVLSDDGILSVDRQPKSTYFAVVDACRPLIVVADSLPLTMQPGDNLDIDIQVVSDLRTDIRQARVSAIISWPGGEIRREWMGDIAADSCARVGAIRLEVPVTIGTLDVHLSVQAGEHTASNHYSTTVIAS